MKLEIRRLSLSIVLTCTVLLCFEVKESYGKSFILKKFDEWRSRCRVKFELLRMFYHIWRNFRRKVRLTDVFYLDQHDFNLLNHTFFGPIKENFLRIREIRKRPGWRKTRLGRIIDVCSQPMGNFSNFIKELRKHSDSFPSTKVAAYETPLPKVRQKLKNERRLENFIRFSVPDGKGGPRWIEIDQKEVPLANLSTIIDWLDSIGILKSHLQEIKDTNPDSLKITLNYNDTTNVDTPSPLEQFNKTMAFLDYLERTLHRELRDPDKEWNYSVE